MSSQVPRTVGWISGAGAQAASQESRQTASLLAREAARAVSGQSVSSAERRIVSHLAARTTLAGGSSLLPRGFSGSINPTNRQISVQQSCERSTQTVSGPERERISNFVREGIAAVSRRAAGAASASSNTRSPAGEPQPLAEQEQGGGDPDLSAGEGGQSTQTRELSTQYPPDRHHITRTGTLPDGYGEIGAGPNAAYLRSLEIFEADLMRSDRLTDLFRTARGLPGHLEQVQGLLRSLGAVPRQSSTQEFNRLVNEVKLVEGRIFNRISELWRASRERIVQDAAFNAIDPARRTLVFRRSGRRLTLQ